MVTDMYSAARYNFRVYIKCVIMAGRSTGKSRPKINAYDSELSLHLIIPQWKRRIYVRVCDYCLNVLVFSKGSSDSVFVPHCY